MQTTETTLPRVIDDCHGLLKWLMPLLDKFPRSRRFTPGRAPGVRPAGRP